jgi:hypothetical protein
MKFLSEAKLEKRHENHSGCWNEVPTSKKKLKNCHETILGSGMKFLSGAKLKIAMKLFWLLE